MITATLEYWGRGVLALFQGLGEFAFLVQATFRWLRRGAIEWRQVLNQMVRIGVDSLPVTAMTSFFTGMVLALQTGASMKRLFNEPLFVGSIVSFSIVMELGPVMTSLVVAGRAGAAIAAELGTMKVTEQVDALYTLGTGPVRYLVIPRLIAFICVLPILAVISDFTGILGGYLVASIKYRIATNTFWHDIIDNMEVRHFMHGFLKTYVFAAVVALISCYRGLATRGGAEGVGRATTAAVVLSMVSVLVMDYFVTAVLVALRIP